MLVPPGSARPRNSTNWASVERLSISAGERGSCEMPIFGFCPKAVSYGIWPVARVSLVLICQRTSMRPTIHWFVLLSCIHVWSFSWTVRLTRSIPPWDCEWRGRPCTSLHCGHSFLTSSMMPCTSKMPLIASFFGCFKQTQRNCASLVKRQNVLQRVCAT